MIYAASRFLPTQFLFALYALEQAATMFDFTDELCVLHENDKYSTVTAQEYQEYYDKGLPIWTREFFENLDRELQEHPERIAVKDVDGSVIVFISKPDTENIIEKETKFTV